MYVCIHVYTYTFAGMHTKAQGHIFIHTHMNVYTFMATHVHTHIHIFIGIHVYTLIQTQRYVGIYRKHNHLGLRYIGS